MSKIGITVEVDQPYDVALGRGLLSDLAAYLPDDAKRLMILFDPVVAGPIPALVDDLRRDGFEVHLLAVPSGEEAKTIAVATAVWQRLGEAGFTRTDVLIGIGGGTTTDLTGFVAATWLRGVPVVLVPTTLLSMVDAAIGGKTGINTDEGKNLVGSFHQPAAVICDQDLLGTLPTEEIVSGMAEVVKAGLVADPSILDVVWSGPQETLKPTSPLLTELIRRAVAVKAEVVADDPDESGRRTILNYGHTFGHAIEQVEHFKWRHGDAVAVGMVYAAEVAVRAGLMDPSLLGLHRELLSAVGLPIAYNSGRWAQLWPAMRRDKKNQGRTRRLVLLEDVGRPVVVRDIPEDLLEEAYQAISAVPGAAPYPVKTAADYTLENPYGTPAYVPPVDEDAPAPPSQSGSVVS
ncbi:MAG: 3-dehydroquinate synthase [Bifidobacteriaceae bacterium]|jgi:3-dehydroquinate synthase|nr:3-dehydroquinate synthase [Bifidobacteriaceae bacterium]